MAGKKGKDNGMQTASICIHFNVVLFNLNNRKGKQKGKDGDIKVAQQVPSEDKVSHHCNSGLPTASPLPINSQSAITKFPTSVVNSPPPTQVKGGHNSTLFIFLNNIFILRCRERSLILTKARAQGSRGAHKPGVGDLGVGYTRDDFEGGGEGLSSQRRHTSHDCFL